MRIGLSSALPGPHDSNYLFTTCREGRFSAEIVPTRFVGILFKLALAVSNAGVQLRTRGGRP